MLDLLKSLIDVDLNEGQIYPKPGTTITRYKNAGYYKIRINGILYAEHHIICAFKEGVWPKEVVDHINGNKTDNRGVNLRSCSWSDNNCNRKMRSDNTIGYKGLFTRKHKSGRIVYGWMIKLLGENISKSGYPTAEKAYEARKKALLEAHGEFANDGLS